MSIFKKYRELIVYIFFGVLTTLVNWLAYWLLTDLLRMDYMPAAFIAQVLSILFAYLTNRTWVFHSQVRGARGIALEMAKFFGARGVSLVLDMACMFVGVDLLSINDKAVKVASSVVVVVANYVFSKVFVFRKAGGE